MNEDKFRACFMLAAFEYSDVIPVQNGYCSQECCAGKPWFLFRTEFGCIQIGWRKRVIKIDWSDTPFRGGREVTNDDVTMDDTYVHAWGYGKAVQYLDTLLQLLRMNRRDQLRAEIAETANA
jgi:hypothetical protein